MKITELEWDETNVEHITLHGTGPTEVEEVCSGPHTVFRGRDERYIVFGLTGAGRYLKVILERLHGDKYRPITAIEMSEGETRAYRKRDR